MMFGPVGHTHNGNDAYHYCHNQLVGNHEAVTLNEYINHFDRAWHSERTRPLPLLLETKYAWEKRYEGFIRRVSYFNESVNNDVNVRGFRFEREEHGNVTMKIKTDPCDKIWLGRNNVPNGPGYDVLAAAPRDVPAEIPGNMSGFGPAASAALEKRGMKNFIDIMEKQEELKWVLDCAARGKSSR